MNVILRRKNLWSGCLSCSCGVNIAGIVDVDQVVSYAATLPHVAYAENNLFSCSARCPGKHFG